MERVRPDIVHTHNLYFQLTMVAPFLKRFAHVPLVTTLHLPKMVYNRILLDSLINVYQRVLGKLIVQSSDRLIAVSRSVMKHAIEDLGAPSFKTFVIPNGVNTRAYLPNTHKGKDVIVTFIGRLIGNKGPNYLIRAAPSILKNHPEVHFYIIGEGPLKDKLIKIATLRKLKDRVHFFGSVPDVLPFLQETTVFVRPSLTEGMSLTVLEAMACGLPIVASNVEGNVEIIDNGKTGYLVPPADSKALAEAIIFLLDNRKIASEIGRSARKKTEKFYDWEQIADQTLKIYLSLTH